MNNWINGANDKKFVVSYSGGKDSALALYKAMEEGTAVGIIVMMEEDGTKSRAHSISPELLKAQAKEIGVPIYTGSASWGTYEKVLVENLEKAKELGAEVLVTGDIDMPQHKCWYEKVASSVNLGLAMPLWNRDHRDVVEEFVNLGFITKIVTVNLSKGMKKEDLGRTLTLEYIKELEDRGIDICGEAGEFHTSVIGGPLFKNDLKVKHGQITSEGDYMYLELLLDSKK